MLAASVFLASALLMSLVLESVQGHGRHVCTEEKEMAIPVPIKQSYTRAVYNAEQNSITYQTAYRTVVKVQLRPQKTAGCCPGWEKASPRDVSCNKPICQDACENGGQCIAPNTCMCPDGYTGYRCQIEINECNGRHTCQQVCTNTPGSYECSCREGFKLTEDGFGCELCLSCAREFKELLYQMDSVVEVRQEMEDMQEMKNRAVKFEEFQKDIVELRELKVKMTSDKAGQEKELKENLENLRSEVFNLKESREVDSRSVSELKSQIVELQTVKSELSSMQELKEQVKSLHNLHAEFKALQELKTELLTLLEMKDLVETIPQLKEDIEGLTYLANKTMVIDQIKSKVETLTREKADVIQLHAVNQSVQLLMPAMDDIPGLQAKVDNALAVASKSEDNEELNKQIEEMITRVERLEKDKQTIQSNLTAMMGNYEAAANALHYREQTTQAAYPTTTPNDLYETDMPMDRLASLSQQISILEEKMAQCSCDDYSRG